MTNYQSRSNLVNSAVPDKTSDLAFAFNSSKQTSFGIRIVFNVLITIKRFDISFTL